LEEKIANFIQQQKNISICTAVNNTPSCASCFYAFSDEGDYLIFKSNRKTEHIVNALINDKLSGTILPDSIKLETVKGVQFKGKFIEPSGDLLEKVKKIYYSKFPFAKLFQGDIFLIALDSVKMTDNTLGFGKKITWEKSI